MGAEPLRRRRHSQQVGRGSRSEVGPAVVPAAADGSARAAAAEADIHVAARPRRPGILDQLERQLGMGACAGGTGTDFEFVCALHPAAYLLRHDCRHFFCHGFQTGMLLVKALYLLFLISGRP